MRKEPPLRILKSLSHSPPLSVAKQVEGEGTRPSKIAQRRRPWRSRRVLTRHDKRMTGVWDKLKGLLGRQCIIVPCRYGSALLLEVEITRPGKERQRYFIAASVKWELADVLPPWATSRSSTRPATSFHTRQSHVPSIRDHSRTARLKGRRWGWVGRRQGGRLRRQKRWRGIGDWRGNARRNGRGGGCAGR